MKLTELEKIFDRHTSNPSILTVEYKTTAVSELPKLLSLIRQMKEALQDYADEEGMGYAQDALIALEQYEAEK